VSYSEHIFQKFLYPIKFFFTQDTLKIPRISFGIIMPLLFGWISYSMVSPKYEPPAELRSIHPTPPAEIEFNNKKLALSKIQNPFRKPGMMESAIIEGREVYYANCMPCHGANLDAKGHWTERLFPIPISFRDPGSISMMPESYIFWRVAKGGPGLPAEATPWKSTMPAFEEDLSEDEIWKVILFIYEETGYVPKSF
jgi:mono/diheme cytochrome c family protein